MTSHGGMIGPAVGAIAQLGERVLCKHEVVGSIPSGSTTLVAGSVLNLRTWFGGCLGGIGLISDIVNRRLVR